MVVVQSLIVASAAAVFLALLLSEWIPGLVPARIAAARNHLLVALPLLFAVAVVSLPVLTGTPVGLDDLIVISQPGYEIDTDLLDGDHASLSIGGSKEANHVYLPVLQKPVAGSPESGREIVTVPYTACSLEPSGGGIGLVTSSEVPLNFVLSVNGSIHRNVPLEDGDRIVVGGIDGTEDRLEIRFEKTSNIADDLLRLPSGERVRIEFHRHEIPLVGLRAPFGIAPQKGTRLYPIGDLVGTSAAGLGNLNSFIYYERPGAFDRLPHLALMDLRDGGSGLEDFVRVEGKTPGPLNPVFPGNVSLSFYEVRPRGGDDPNPGKFLARMGSVSGISYVNRKIWIPLPGVNWRGGRRLNAVSVNLGDGRGSGQHELSRFWISTGSLALPGSLVRFGAHSRFFESSQGLVVFGEETLQPDQFHTISGEVSRVVEYGKDFVFTKDDAFRIRYRILRVAWPVRIFLGGLLVLLSASVIGREAFRDFRFVVLLVTSWFLITLRLLFAVQTALRYPFETAGFKESLHLWFVWPLLFGSLWFLARVVAGGLRGKGLGRRSGLVLPGVSLAVLAIGIFFVLWLRGDSVEPLQFLVGLALPALLTGILLALLLPRAEEKLPELRNRTWLKAWAEAWAKSTVLTRGESQMLLAGLILVAFRGLLWTVGVRESFNLGETRLSIDIVYIPVAAVLFGRACARLLVEADGSRSTFVRAVLVSWFFLAAAFGPGLVISDLGLILPSALGCALTLAFWGHCYRFSRRADRWLRFMSWAAFALVLVSPFLMTLIFRAVLDPTSAVVGREYLIQRMYYLNPDELSASGTKQALRTEEHLVRMSTVAFQGGFLGSGYLSRVPRPGADFKTDYSDNAPAVFVFSQFGFAGALLLGLVLVSPLALLMRVRGDPDARTEELWLESDFSFLALAATVACSGLFLLAGNSGLMPLTGKNVPFLAITSGSDVLASMAMWFAMLWFLQLPRGGLRLRPEGSHER